MSNSENMNLSERLAQKIKASPLGELLDEDDLGEICKRAIEEAFFKPREERDRYNSVARFEPLIIEEARKAYREAMVPIFQTAAKELAETPAFRELLAQAAIGLIPDMMMNVGRQALMEGASRGAQMAIEQVQQMARSGVLGR